MSQQLVNMIRRGQKAEIAALVQEEPGAALARDAQGVSLLMWSIYAHQPEITQCLQPAVGDLDIFEAAALGDSVRLRELIAADAMQVWAVSGDGWTPLHLACAFAGPDAVKLLLEHGAHTHQYSHNPQHNQALHAALALCNSEDTVRLLLDADADVNAVQAGGFTPLHQVAAAGKPELIKLLLSRGARAEARCDQGKLPIDYARERRHAAAVEVLQAAGAPQS
ncbi:MAG TPA: ankyrin repeat domain-containing protein [Acidobacteriaceae bacterium]|nr:ankyrin repeat domain-containing protein [Acidobacteriaceae bacterium]